MKPVDELQRDHGELTSRLGAVLSEWAASHPCTNGNEDIRIEAMIPLIAAIAVELGFSVDTLCYEIREMYKWLTTDDETADRSPYGQVGGVPDLFQPNWPSDPGY